MLCTIWVDVIVRLRILVEPERCSAYPGLIGRRIKQRAVLDNGLVSGMQVKRLCLTAI
jgi:hypothetical protein